MKELAQIQIAPQGGFTGFGPLGNPGTQGINVFTSVVSTIIGILTLVGFLWFILLFITGALGIMSAGGDKQKLETSRTKIINGIVGLVVVILAVSIISLIGFLFNIPFLDLPALFSRVVNGTTTP